jgi:hypothetical protein
MARHIEAALAASHGIEGPFGAAGKLRVNPHMLRPHAQAGDRLEAIPAACDVTARLGHES